MPRRSIGEYPTDWHDIAADAKERAGWKCVRCGHAHDRESGHVLTVHHLDMNPANCHESNLAVLCQRCHLHIQAKVNMDQGYLYEHSEWMQSLLDAGERKAVSDGQEDNER